MTIRLDYCTGTESGISNIAATHNDCNRVMRMPQRGCCHTREITIRINDQHLAGSAAVAVPMIAAKELPPVYDLFGQLPANILYFHATHTRVKPPGRDPLYLFDRVFRI